MAGITTHVLDTLNGRPAAGMRIEFSAFLDDVWQRINTELTNADGRTGQPLLAASETKVGRYRLIFHVADYFRGCGVELPDPPFLDRVPIEFGVSDTGTHYHVPLLCTPWTYTTYRGS